jgi:hypothetical protein
MRLPGKVAPTLLALAALVLTGAPARGNETIEHLGGQQVLVADGNGVACRDATAAEATWFAARDGEPMRVLEPGRARRRDPLARQTFLDAAAQWESIIGSPITVVIDVDFGPTLFGTQFPERVIGGTFAQYPSVSQSPSYEAMRGQLIERASTLQEAAIYDQLPAGPAIATTGGEGSLVRVPTPVMRALGFLPNVADPDAEASLGDPPAIGFNSNFSFDFDPSNGIEGSKTDFYGVVLHEIGHALGFVSWSGLREMSPSAPLLLTTWDLFRFRPGVTLGTFGTAQRVTVSSGSAVYFAGTAALPLSTGRPNGQGGDGRQASHWKDNVLNAGRYIGVMDPTVGPGERLFITDNDLEALGFIGYQIGLSPVVGSLAVEVVGDAVTFTGQVTDGNGDAQSTSLRFDVLDKNGVEVGDLDVLQSSVTGTGAALSFAVTAGGLGDLVGAYFGRITATDARGNVTTATVDLGLAEPGGPNLSSARFKRNKLKLDGAGFAGTLQLEVNGAVTTAPLTIKANRAGTKVTIKVDAATLGLGAGTNRIRIYANGLRSNIFELEL